MKGQEHHKQFAVKCFAQFMTRSQVSNESIEKLKDELSKSTIVDNKPDFD